MALMQGLIKKLGGEDDEYGYHQPQGMTNGKVGQLPLQGPGVPIGGGDRGYEMPGTGRSGGVEDATRMLADATAQNDRLKELGNRRAQLDIFDRPGHTALDQEESSIFGRPRSSYVDTPNGAPGGPMASSLPSGGLSPSVFQSPNQSVRGYLDEAMKAFAPTVKGIADEAGRKSAVEKHLQSLLPEIQKRGGSLSDIRGEKARVDGRMIDFYRDIEGAADPQYLDVTDEGPAQGGGARPMFAGSSIAPLLHGDAQANIQQALSGFGQAQDDSLLQRLIAQLQGGQ